MFEPVKWHKPYAEWAVFVFEPDTFGCGHYRTTDNTYEFTRGGYACTRCLTCKQKNNKRARQAVIDRATHLEVT